MVDPGLPSWCASHNGTIAVQRLDLDNVRILSATMAQTVVLQYYEEVVDRLHDTVAMLNAHIERREIGKLDTQQLHRCVHLALCIYIVFCKTIPRNIIIPRCDVV